MIPPRPSPKPTCFLPPAPTCHTSATRATRRRRLPHACDATPAPQQSAQAPPRKRPYGYWKVRSNVLSELSSFVDAHGQPSVMPTQSELLAAGRADLAGAIRRYGSWKEAADDAGLVLSSIVKPRSLNLVFCTDLKLRSGRMRPYMYWRDFDNVRAEITQFMATYCAEHVDEGEQCENVIPRAMDLEAAGRSDLVRAIRMHGGWGTVAKRLDIHPRPTSATFWSEFTNVEAEVRRIAAQRMDGREGLMPPLEILKKYGSSGLHTAITRRYGGAAKVAKRMGLHMAIAKKPRGFWAKEDNLRAGVQTALKEICKAAPGRDLEAMPSVSELRSIGRFDVASAVERWGGVIEVAKRLGVKPPSATGRTRGRPSR